MTFAVAGVDFISADIVLSGGQYGAAGVSIVTGNPFDATGTPGPTSSAATVSAATTRVTSSATSGPTSGPTSPSSPTGPMSQSASIQYISAIKAYSFDQNVTYTFNLVLYTQSGMISASKCRNTVIQIVPSLSNNSNNFFNYTFYVDYLLIGGGGGGGAAGGTLNSIVGGPGQGGYTGMIQESTRFIMSSSSSSLPKTLPRTVPEPIITYSRLTTGTSRLSQIGVPGGMGGNGVQPIINAGNPGAPGTDAQIQCNQYLSDAPIVAKGGMGGSGGKPNINSQMQNDPLGQKNESPYKLGWGGDGGRTANSPGVDGNTGIIDLDLFYFTVNGGSDVNIPTTTPPVCPVVTCAAAGSSLASTPTPDTSETKEWEFDWILSILDVNHFTVNTADPKQESDFVNKFAAVFPVPPYNASVQAYAKSAALAIYRLLPMVHVGASVTYGGTTSATNATNLGSTTVTKSGNIITLRPSAPPRTVIPDSKYASYPAWQFQFTHSTNVDYESLFVKDVLFNETNGLYTSIMNAIGQNLTLPFEIQNNLNSKLNDLTFNDGKTAAPSAKYCQAPQNSNAYNLAYDYASDGFWVPVHLFLSSATMSGSTQTVKSIDLNMWYLFVGTDGVLRGPFAYPNNGISRANQLDLSQDTTTQRPDTEFKVFNSLPLNITHLKSDLYCTMYLPYTDGVIRYSNN